MLPSAEPKGASGLKSKSDEECERMLSAANSWSSSGGENAIQMYKNVIDSCPCSDEYKISAKQVLHIYRTSSPYHDSEKSRKASLALIEKETARCGKALTDFLMGK